MRARVIGTGGGLCVHNRMCNADAINFEIIGPMEMHTPRLFIVFVLVAASVERVAGGCRMQARNPCESLCQWNAERQQHHCELRAVVILPKTNDVEASLPRVSTHSIHPIIMFAQKISSIWRGQGARVAAVKILIFGCGYKQL